MQKSLAIAEESLECYKAEEKLGFADEHFGWKKRFVEERLAELQAKLAEQGKASAISE